MRKVRSHQIEQSADPNGCVLATLSMQDRYAKWCHQVTTAWGVLVVSLLLTGLAWHLTNRHVDRRKRDHFNFRIAEVQSKIEERMLQYEQVLRDGAALYTASEKVTRQEWRDYVRLCQIPEYFPGIQAMAVSIVVHPDDKQSHIDSVRAEGFPHYQLHPEGDRDLYSAILFIEPFDWRNQRAFGYDMYSEAVRREAMDRAARSGEPAVSGKITLVQETDHDVQAGVLCYLPVYANRPLSDAEERREALRGWVYAAFRLDDLMAGIVGDNITDISFQIFDTADISQTQILFDSEGADPKSAKDLSGGFIQRKIVPVSGRDWTIQFAATSGSFASVDPFLSPSVAIAGLLIDILLFLVISSIGRQRSTALRLAEQMTREFKESESCTRSILENASDAILLVAMDGKIAIANEAANRIFQPEQSSVGANPLTESSFDDYLDKQTFAEIIHTATSSDGFANGCEDGILARCRRHDGTTFRCRMSIGAVDGDDGYIVIARDETARLAFEKELAETNRQLVSASHKAGMAEVATGALHNVGNSLNGVSTSSSLIEAMLDDSPISSLSKAVTMINQNRDNLGHYLVHDKQGKHFAAYLTQVTAALVDQKEKLAEENSQLGDHVRHINQIIRSQQDQASSAVVVTEESVSELMTQAALVNFGRHPDYDIVIEHNFQTPTTIMTDRNKVLQVLVNLVANAQDAVRDVMDTARTVSLYVEDLDNEVRFVVSDNGPGISAVDLPRIREFGFTTKTDGHGFGLHSCAIVAEELHGDLQIQNNASGVGARFTLILPLSNPDSVPNQGSRLVPVMAVADVHSPAVEPTVGADR
ncbi:Sensor protein FixL [Rubripirellula lacrimiformis]|uniref:histidine kinase n=1 Tax=Rubripirellula lacrimiformis TaxID=1930273 RepID=A0A517NIJ3_9BACT|nr:CHASE domain-containing protein [Rubripirellula lacrimiformis]QDT06954.1 Sensor protein FixL [Rubripirellula lacrimiformis]